MRALWNSSYGFQPPIPLTLAIFSSVRFCSFSGMKRSELRCAMSSIPLIGHGVAVINRERLRPVGGQERGA
jgi:hypothetical protein